MFLKINDDCIIKFEDIELIEKTYNNNTGILIFLEKKIAKSIFFGSEELRDAAFDKISQFLNAKDLNEFLSEIEVV